jgi:hypothetical protein
MLKRGAKIRIEMKIISIIPLFGRKNQLMLKKILLLLSLFAFAASGATSYTNQRRLTVTNRSGMDIAVGLQGVQEGEFYYLQVPEGTSTFPTVRDFTLIRDVYAATIYFIEAYDPVYGFQCTAASTQVNAVKNTWLEVGECRYEGVKTTKEEKPFGGRRGLPAALGDRAR